jgi:hypothetical protein
MLFTITDPVTVNVLPEIVNVELPVKVTDANGFAGVTESVGRFVVAGIITTSPLAEPGFPFGLQLVVIAHAVPDVPVQV